MPINAKTDPACSTPRNPLPAIPSPIRRAPSTVTASLAGAVLLAAANPARADAIDGSWCSETGRRIAIEGSAGMLGKGIRIEGQYTRHSYAFTMPPAEADAGAAVEMVLQGETRVRIRIGALEPQIWRRCPADIS